MPDLAFVFNDEGRLVTWNKNVEVVSGFSKRELKNKFVSEFIYAKDKERVLKKFMEILADGDSKERTIEYNIQTKSGDIIPHLAMRSLVVIDGKKFIIGIAINISNVKKDEDKEILNAHIVEINHLKKQLQGHYQKIESINQAEIELKENLFLNAKAFNDKLINNLPGIFYLYEKIDDKFFLKKWNINYKTDLGYSEDELLNVQPHQFFIEKEYTKVVAALAGLFITGSAEVDVYTTHKDGRQIPYYYKAYRFQDQGKIYFMGVGIDVSFQYDLKKKQKLQKAEKKKAKKIFEANKRELVATALYVSKSNKMIVTAQKQIDQLLKKHKETTIYDELNALKRVLKIQSSEQDNWEVFKLQFTEVHKDFFQKLKAKHPSLSKSEVKFCAYLRIHLTSSQISSVLNVTNEAIKKARYRIRKKLPLSPKESLEDYIEQF